MFNMEGQTLPAPSRLGIDNIAKLSQEDKDLILSRIIQQMYFEDGVPAPEAEWDSSTIEEVACVLDQYHLIPTGVFSKADADEVAKFLTEKLPLNLHAVTQDDNGDNEYTDVKWYSKDIGHSEFGQGSFVIIVSLAPTMNDRNYATLKFNTESGDWFDVKYTAPYTAPCDDFDCLEAIIADMKQVSPIIC